MLRISNERVVDMSRRRPADYGTSSWRARVFKKRAIGSLVCSGIFLFIGLVLIGPLMNTIVYTLWNGDDSSSATTAAIVGTAFQYIFIALSIFYLIFGLLTLGRARRWAKRAAGESQSPSYSFHYNNVPAPSKATPVKQKPVKTNPREEKRRLEEMNYRLQRERLEKALSYTRGRAIIERTFETYLEEVNALLLDSLHEDLNEKERKKLEPVSGVCEIEYGKDSNVRGTACLIKLTLVANYADVEKLSMVLESKAQKEALEDSSEEDDYEKESRRFYEKGKQGSIQFGSNELVNELIYRVNGAIGPIWESNGQAIFLNGQLIDEFVYRYEIDWKLPHGMKKNDLPAGFESQGSIVAKIVL